MRHACVNDAYTLSGGLGLLCAVCEKWLGETCMCMCKTFTLPLRV